MSGYGKGQEGNLVYGYGATRSEPDQSYAVFATPQFSSPYSDAPTRASHEPLLGSQFEPRDAPYQQPYSNILSPLPQPRLEITSFSPSKATNGQKIYIRLRSKFDLTVPTVYRFSVMYYQKRCEAALSKLDQSTPYFNYALEADIPPFDTTGSLESQVPLVLHMEDEYGQSISVVEVGDFTYETMDNYPVHQTKGKRKRSGSEDSTRSPAKRISQANIRGGGRLNTSTYYPAVGQLPASPPTPNLSTAPIYYEPYRQRISSSSYPQMPELTAPVPPQTRIPHTGYSPYMPISPPGRATSIAGTPIGKPVLPSSSDSTAPTLVRTPTVQQTTATPGTNSHPFNPYLYPSKAVLKIDGDLDRMADDWSREEKEVRRRLVQFRRRQTGSTITANFNAVTPEERTPHSICISCIWWAEKQDWFVTSVDTIFLLESLVAVRFTVEEKNRIRRNLEGFRPLTVSKVKADSEDFFKIIMGFPNPKPRNIEKDVKVFPWKILAHALKKIISKYSASYSSTAGPMPPSTVSYNSGSMSEAGTDTRYTISPRNRSISGAPTQYQNSSVTSPSAGPGRLSAGPQGQRTPSVSQASWHTAQHAPTPYTDNLSSYGRGASIDYAVFLTEPGLHDQSARTHHTSPHGGVEKVGRQRGNVGSHMGDYKLPGYGHRTSQG
ncbi:hypothetical protein EJ05DRAFT_236590 [Pseudovirgaria hyperparasitica]|uniref:DUF7082 domain-containing protein n=1 Tax=Pseudovirgaria hyperparasitica TaxID=470096 RepID=A0A6A6VT09_9PEZI|nr:uncharacterized protein EJ05DRAFT_236590 [Pseudovirgaria hyperparasitica]KAF2752894.1 hypothetical protein EJ05DRAFT_236590 [Pseudovirgaria hyperparasitica]